MALRPSYKLEPSTEHGLIEVERLPAGLTIEIHDVATVDEEPVEVRLHLDEARELSAMLRAVLGAATSDELATLNRAQQDEPSPASI